MRSELEVLVDQLDELLDEGAVDGSDALEIAIVAGIAERLGAAPDVLAPAVEWRSGPGGPLLDEIWAEVASDDPLEELDDMVTRDPDLEELEEALYDVDDLVAAAVWSGHTSAIAGLSRRLADLIRDVPEVFEPLAHVGGEMAQQRAVGERYDLYGYWFALADLRAIPEA
ncbi:MAG: hypothetical protein ACI8PZ_005373 [Myxococcota bacterium]